MLDIDKDGVNDIVVTSREAGAGMVWYRRGKIGWTIYPIDRGLNIEAGGACADIDGDGDLDLVFGEDYTGSRDCTGGKTPIPLYGPKTPWVRREIKSSGEKMHHDQIFGDFVGDGRNQLAFWVQEIRDPVAGDRSPAILAQTSPWPAVPIARRRARRGNGQGRHRRRRQDRPDRRRILVQASRRDDLSSPCSSIRRHSTPERPPASSSKERRPRWSSSSAMASGGSSGSNGCAAPGSVMISSGEDVVHGHSLELADIDQDGHLDIFCAEMAQWTDGAKIPDNPGARMWIFYGDGHGRFAKTVLARGVDNHESRVRDLDGDGDLDIVVKPYTHDTPRLDVWLNDGRRPPVKNRNSD